MDDVIDDAPGFVNTTEDIARVEPEIIPNSLENRNILGDCDWYDDLPPAEYHRIEQWHWAREQGIDIEQVNNYNYGYEGIAREEIQRIKLTDMAVWKQLN